MITQWQDELAQKFGLSFTILDRDYLATSTVLPRPTSSAKVHPRQFERLGER
jgi:hypothetical protein